RGCRSRSASCRPSRGSNRSSIASRSASRPSAAPARSSSPSTEPERRRQRDAHSPRNQARRRLPASYGRAAGAPLQSSIALQQPTSGLDRAAPICRSAPGARTEGAGRLQQETLVLDKPEQLKALGHPLRVRVLEMLGQEGEWQLTNREL